MQIKCDFCGNTFEDTLTKCPNCGGINQHVARTAKDQPLTIEDLKKWYKDKGLPPYETTRFFIGENVTFARAFGIYQEGSNFIVYKNKADGTRAVRYKGEDEAYAVNELFQRLKQEILQQKSNNISKAAGASSSYASGDRGKRARNQFKSLILVFAFIMGAQFLGVMAIFINQAINSDKIIEPGYYKSSSDYYYYDQDTARWFSATIVETSDSFEENCIWNALDFAPSSLSYNRLNKKKRLKEIYVSREYDASLESVGVEDFRKSLDYQDYLKGNHIESGYYSCEDTTYYHISDDRDDDWYYYDRSDDDWCYVPYDSLPVELRHYDSSTDFYVTKTWDESTQVSDFESTDFYESWQEEQERNTYNSYDDDSNSYDNDNSYDWDSDDSWDSFDTDWDGDW